MNKEKYTLAYRYVRLLDQIKWDRKYLQTRKFLRNEMKEKGIDEITRTWAETSLIKYKYENPFTTVYQLCRYHYNPEHTPANNWRIHVEWFKRTIREIYYNGQPFRKNTLDNE